MSEKKKYGRSPFPVRFHVGFVVGLSHSRRLVNSVLWPGFSPKCIYEGDAWSEVEFLCMVSSHPFSAFPRECFYVNVNEISSLTPMLT